MPMHFNSSSLPSELVEAAQALERRFQILRVPSYKVPPEEWEPLFPHIPSLIPAWIPALLSNYALVGGGLEYPHHSIRKYTWPVQFGFFAPRNFMTDLVDGDEYPELLRFGYFPFANDNENLWLSSLADGPSGKIYWLEHSGWDGDQPDVRNGLVYAHRNLAALLSCMAVTDASIPWPVGSMWQEPVQ
jgi:hypothetical protein